MKYDKIFNTYTTYQGIPFYNLSKSVTFPQDDNLEIYDYVMSDEDYPWTIASYKLYGTIEHWWVLSALNPSMRFYSQRGRVVKIIKPMYLDKVLGLI